MANVYNGCSGVIKTILKNSLNKYGVKGIDEIDLATILLRYDINLYDDDLDNLHASCREHFPDTADYDMVYISAFRRSIEEYKNGGPIHTKHSYI